MSRNEKWWPAGNRTPEDIGQYKEMSASDFETFAVEVIKSYFAPHGVMIMNTPPVADGARDAEGGIEIADEEFEGALELSLKVWVEAKRHARNAGLAALGQHLVAAVIAHAQKIIFVASGDFSDPMKKQLREYSNCTGLRCGFVNGRDLLALCAKINNRPDQSQVGEEAANLGAMPTKPTIAVESVRFSNTWLADRQAEPVKHIRFGDPVFVFVRASLNVPLPPKTVNLRVRARRATPEGASLSCIGETCLENVGPRETVERVFVFHPQEPGPCRADAFEVDCEIGEGVAVTAPIASEMAVDIVPSLLPYVPTEPQRETLERAGETIDRWTRTGGTRAIGIEAAAGIGKSRVITALRPRWLGRGLPELRLDGSTEVDEWAAMLRVFSYVLPVDLAEVRASHHPALRRWLEDAGIGERQADAVARAVCSETVDRGRISAEMLGDIFAGLLHKSAPAVLVFEDLHKAGHGVIRLLRECLFALARRGTSILIVFTSRYLPTGPAAEEPDIWTVERRRLFEDDRIDRYRMKPPSTAECGAILRGALPDLNDDEVAAIVDQVGRSPFALSETLHYLRSLGVLSWDETLGRDIVLDPVQLHDRIHSQELADATAKRLAVLSRSFPGWAADLLDSAACFGRVFDVTTCLNAQGNAPATIELDAFLSACMRENVFDRSASGGRMGWQFDHDLVRVAALDALVRDNRPRHIRLAEELLAICRNSLPSSTRLSLVYQTGDGGAFVADAEQVADEWIANFDHADAADLLDRVAVVLDDHRPINTGESRRNRLDAAFSIAPRPRIAPDRRQADRNRQILDVLTKRIGAMAVVSSGSSRDIEADLTVGMMLARRLHAKDAEADMLARHGQLLLERGDEAASLEKHREAEALFASLSGRAHRQRRADNLVRLAIALRHMDRPEDSAAALDDALRISSGRSDLKVIYLANVGALYFYTDADQRRRYWTEAYEEASRSNNAQMRVHMALDLANLDILENHLDRALDRIRDAMEEASPRGLANSLMRGQILHSAWDLLACRPDDAIERLHEAYKIAIAHSIDRRAWKIQGNLATAYEMLGDWEQAYVQDRRSIQTLQPDKVERRRSIPLGNIALRKDKSTFHARLYDSLPRRQQELATRLAYMALNAETRPNTLFPAEHCKSICDQRRFIMT